MRSIGGNAIRKFQIINFPKKVERYPLLRETPYLAACKPKGRQLKAGTNVAPNGTWAVWPQKNIKAIIFSFLVVQGADHNHAFTLTSDRYCRIGFPIGEISVNLQPPISASIFFAKSSCKFLIYREALNSMFHVFFFK